MGNFYRRLRVIPVVPSSVRVCHPQDRPRATVPASSAMVVASIPIAGRAATDVYNPDTNDVYVAINDQKEVQVVDSATDAVVATIMVGNDPDGAAVNALTNRVYVANVFSDTVSVIDAATNTVVATPTVGSAPTQLAVNPQTDTVYVANFNSSTVSVIDGATNAVTTVSDPSHLIDSPVGVAINLATNTIYVANDRPQNGPGAHNLVFIDGATHAVTGALDLGTGCRLDGDRYDPANNAVYVGDFCGNISVIDAATNTLASKITPNGAVVVSNIGVDPTVNLAFANDAGNHFVSEIDTATNTVLQKITGATISEPSGNFINPFAHKDYAPDHDSNTVNVIGGYTAPATITAPTKTCAPSASSTSCTLTLSSPLPYLGSLVDTLTSPSGATISGCANPTAGLICGVTAAGSAVALCVQTSCTTGSSVQVALNGASGGGVSEQVFIGGQTFTVTPTLVTAPQVTPPQVTPPPVETAPTETCTATAVSVGQSTVCALTLTSALGPTSYLVKSISSPSGATITKCSATGGLSCQPLGSNATSVTVNCPGPTACAAGATVTLTITSTTTGALRESVSITPAGFLAQSFTVTPSPSVSFVAASNAAPTQSCNGQVIPLAQLCPSPLMQPVGPQPLPVVIPFPAGLN